MMSPAATPIDDRERRIADLARHYGRMLAGMNFRSTYRRTDQLPRRTKSIRHVASGRVYPSVVKAAEALGVHAQTLAKAAREGRSVASGKWEYVQ